MFQLHRIELYQELGGEGGFGGVKEKPARLRPDPKTVSRSRADVPKIAARALAEEKHPQNFAVEVN
jgi:hypothetical protein